MAVTAKEFWQSIANDFIPVGRVRPEDVVRFFVDRNGQDVTRSVVQLLKLSLQDSVGQPKPYKGLLTGHVGSGKSSELIRLAQELATDFFVVWFDAESSLLPESANQFDILLAMGVAVHDAARVAGFHPDPKLANDLTKSLAKFVRTYENRKGFSLNLDQLVKQIFAFAFTTGVGMVAGPVAAGATAVATGIADATRLELNIDDKFVKMLELPPNRQEVIGALNKIIEGTQKSAGKPLLVITDGLDKSSAARARQLFADSALLAEPACALVYAAPIEFYHRLLAEQAANLFDEYLLLPNPPIARRPLTGEHWQMEREPAEEGLQVMRNVLNKRLAGRGEVVTEIVTTAAVDVLAKASGGIMRELIRLFRDAIRIARLLGVTRIDETIAQDAVNRQRQEIAPRLNVQHREALRVVLRQGTLSGGQHESVEDELLRSLHLLSYQDEQSNFWFDAYPSVLSLL